MDTDLYRAPNNENRLLKTCGIQIQRMENANADGRNGGGGGAWASHSDPVAADQGTKDWAGYAAWAIEKNVRGMCGEVGGPATAGQYLTAVRRLCDMMASHRMPVVFWMGGTGQNDSYANGMNTKAGVLKPNAAPLMERIGRTFPSYGPKK